MNNLLLKIIRNLIRPHKIPKKILNKLNYYFNSKKYNQDIFEKEQNDIFKHIGLNRKEGLKKLTLLKRDLDFHNFYFRKKKNTHHQYKKN